MGIGSVAQSGVALIETLWIRSLFSSGLPYEETLPPPPATTWLNNTQHYDDLFMAVKCRGNLAPLPNMRWAIDFFAGAR
jgi:hypothetical protein